MKFLVSQFSYFLSDRQARRNLGALRAYLLFLFAIILAYSVLFHFVMILEGQEHSWLTGLYWTLTVMSTLGFGDITFQSDIGRGFSIIVLASGVVLLLVMLPFAFIRYFYAPWLEAQIRAKVPRRLPESTRGHVIICQEDSITRGLIRKLKVNRIPYCVLEPDPVVATQLSEEGLKVVTGEVDDPETYKAIRIGQARLLLVNTEDSVNTNILLTVRSLNASIPIIALAEEEDSLDIFSLSGATYPLPLKIRLGEHLATRVSAGVGTAHEVGRFKDLVIVEFLVHDTPLSGRTLREASLREETGINVVGVWESGHLQPTHPDKRLEDSSVPVAIGTGEQVTRLNKLLGEGSGGVHSVLVIGGGKVGRSTAKSLKRRGVSVCILDCDPTLEEELKQDCDRVVVGNAADRDTLKEAGINTVSSVALTTNDDAQNIHLAVYCRRLRPELSIVSRITRERNIEAIYRAGADFVLSYSSLGCEFIMAYLLKREPVLVGEGAEFFTIEVPRKLKGKTLAGSEIGARAGLVVIAIEEGGKTITNPAPDTRLNPDSRLVMLGTNEQREHFNEIFG